MNDSANGGLDGSSFVEEAVDLALLRIKKSWKQASIGWREGKKDEQR